MGGQLGNETCIDVLLESSALSPPNFILDRERRFLYEFSVEKLVLLSFRGYLGEIESGKKKMLEFFVYFLFCECAVLCQGQRFQFSSPNS